MMGKTLDRLRAVFHNAATEREFREHVQAANRWQLMFGLFLLIIPLIIFAKSDYVLFNLSPQFWQLLAARGLVLLVFLTTIILANRAKQLWKLDNFVLATTFLLSGLILYINQTRPPEYLQHSIIDILVLLAMYFLIPNRFAYQVLAAGVLTTFSIFNFLVFRDPAPALPTTVFWVSYFFANAMGIWFARHLHMVQRQRHLALLKQQVISAELEAALAEVKTLEGILPICSHCKKIRKSDGYWQQVEAYISTHSDAKFSHSLCEDCVAEHYSDLE